MVRFLDHLRRFLTAGGDGLSTSEAAPSGGGGAWPAPWGKGIRRRPWWWWFWVLGWLGSWVQRARPPELVAAPGELPWAGAAPAKVGLVLEIVVLRLGEVVRELEEAQDWAEVVLELEQAEEQRQGPVQEVPEQRQASELEHRPEQELEQKLEQEPEQEQRPGQGVEQKQEQVQEQGVLLEAEDHKPEVVLEQKQGPAPHQAARALEVEGPPPAPHNPSGAAKRAGTPGGSDDDVHRSVQNGG